MSNVELPIADCDLKVTVGADGVWLHFGRYAAIQVHNVLGQGYGVIPDKVNEWCIARQKQATLKIERSQGGPG